VLLDAQLEAAGVEVIRQHEHRGVSVARTRGLWSCTTEWVAFLDDDDAWLPSHLRHLLAAISRAPERDQVVIAYSGCIVTDASRRMLNLIAPAESKTLARDLFAGNVLPTPSCVVARSATVRQVGGFDGRLSVSADWDLWLRISQLGCAVASDAFTVVYTQHRHNMHHRTDQVLIEVEMMAARYGREATLRGLNLPDRDFPAYIAGSLLAGGHNMRAALWYWRSFRTRGTRSDLLRIVAALAHVRRPRWLRQVPFEGGTSSLDVLAKLRDVDQGKAFYAR
jgi:glycosyltransferase involved in cell wall biosynthesis